MSSEQRKTLVVNLYGGPGTGKSTTAAGAFSLLKRQGVSVELVTEYAKDLVWEGSLELLNSNQIHVFAEQHRRMVRLQGKVDVIITDSPLLLTLFYGRTNVSELFKQVVEQENDRFWNRDIFLRRRKPYQQAGRTQTEDEARLIDDWLYQMLIRRGPYYTFDADDDAAQCVAKVVNLCLSLPIEQQQITG